MDYGCTRAQRAFRHGLSFDVEDWYHVSNFERCISPSDWPKLESRVETNTERILELLDAFEVRATFFVLGCVAERFPKLVKRIALTGHEIGTHSYWHNLVYRLTPGEFRDDLRRSVKTIEDCAGAPVLGHRAPSFSITDRSLWALDILQDEGLRYDSSVFPVRHPRYGMPSAPRVPHQIRSGLWEIPPATIRMAQRNIPVAGGGYFRIFPYAVTSLALRRLEREGTPGVVYLHPWEFDPEQPRVRAPFHARFRHYTNLHRTERRLERLLGEFHFATLSELIPAEEKK